MAFDFSRVLAALSLLFISLSVAQAPQDPVADFCRIFSHQTSVIDRKLYRDGGYVNANPISQNPQAVINQGLLYQNLGVLSSDGMPQMFANLSKNNTVPDLAGGILWTDDVNKIFYLYGGESATAPQSFSLWGYDTVLNQWNKSTSPSTDIGRVAWGAGTTVGARAEGYYYGGYLNNQTTPAWSGPQIATSNLVKYDMIRNVWTNNTGPDAIGRAEGVMVTVPASRQGLLVYFGGATFPYGNATVVGASMNTIYLYDIAEGKWYTQTASGDTPASRRRFCAGVTWAQDQSSYNIYLYGGAGFGENATGFDDVYILTMPSFVWIKWYPTQPGQGVPHNSLSCDVIDGAQMLIIGGTFPNSSQCDAANVWGTHNLDLGKNNPQGAKWNLFNPNLTTYNVPPEIISVVGGSATGGATNNSPASGWSNRDLQVYFTQTASYAARTATRALPSPTSSPSPSSAPHHNSNGAVIGGAVGGVLGALLIALVVFLFCIRRHRRTSQNPKHSSVQQHNRYDSDPTEFSRPSELPAQNGMVGSPNVSSANYVEQKRFSPPPSTSSPVHSYGSNTPPPLIDTSMNQPISSPTYQHPAHQSSSQHQYFPPPPAKDEQPLDSQHSPPVLRPQPINGGSYELPTVRSPHPLNYS